VYFVIIVCNHLTYQTDAGKADIFYDKILPQYSALHSQAMKRGEYGKAKVLDKNFFDLMQFGFNKRYNQELNPSQNIVRNAVVAVKNYLELGKSKEVQLQELKEEELNKRGAWLKIIPPVFHKYFYYFVSLYKIPSAGDMLTNMILGGFFSFIVFAHQSLRSSLMYYIMGNLLMASTLLTRGIKQRIPQPGEPRKQPGTWSKNAFRTAIAIVLLYSASLNLLFNAFFSILPIKLASSFKIKYSIIASTLSAAYITTFYEVYEEKGKNGWRWQKAMDDALPEAVRERLNDLVYGTRRISQKYDYDYDPQVDDLPPAKKIKTLAGALLRPYVICE